MDSVLAFTVFGVDWEFFKPYIVLGLAFGGVYALSGVGMVVLYKPPGCSTSRSAPSAPRAP